MVSLKAEMELHWKHFFSSPLFSTHLLKTQFPEHGLLFNATPLPLALHSKPTDVPGAVRNPIQIKTT